jgi:hypothetical protein
MAVKRNEIDPNTILAVGGLVLLYMGGRNILQAFNVVPDQADRNAQTQITQMQTDDYFSPNYYTKFPGALLIRVADANILAKRIYDAKGVFNDDENAVYGVFQSLKTKSQVSFLASVFYTNYKKSLYGYLLSFLNTQEMANVAAICNKLPKSQA